MRERRGLSAAKMSVILHIGVNPWRHYETMAVPSVSNGRIIRSIMSQASFWSMLNEQQSMG